MVFELSHKGDWVMKEKIARFMYGRYGVDQFSRFLTFAALALLILKIFIKGLLGSILWYAAVILLVYAYFRMFSKNFTKRRAENAKYLKLSGPIINELKNKRERFSQRKDFAFFKCPSCKAVLRVPRGKGKIRVTCRKCGTAFERKT